MSKDTEPIKITTRSGGHVEHVDKKDNKTENKEPGNVRAGRKEGKKT